MIKTIFLALLIAFLSSCCVIGNCPNRATIQMNAVRYLNPDNAGRAKPLVVTVYQLESGSSFSESSYQQLMNNPQTILGNKLIDRDDIEIQPGKKREETIALKSNTSAIGIVASYQHIGNNKWKAIIPIIKHGKQESTTIHLSLESTKIAIHVAKSGWRPW